MSDTNKFLIGILIVGIIAGLAIGFSVKKEPNLGYGHGANIIADNVTGNDFGQTWASTTKSSIFGENANRSYAWMGVNYNCTNTVTIQLTTSTDTLIAGKGILLNATSTNYYEIGPDNLWIGGVYVITDAGECAVSWFEK